MLRRLEAFVNVVELKSFSKAAELMYLSQPSISTYIRNLEEEYNTTLILRSSKEVTPTMAGKTFYTFAKNMLSMQDHLSYAMDGLNEEEIILNVLTTSIPNHVILPKVVSDFWLKHRNIQINLLEKEDVDIVKDIENLQKEFAIVSRKKPETNCKYSLFYTDPIVFFTASTNPIDKDKVYHYNDILKKHYFVEGNKSVNDIISIDLDLNKKIYITNFKALIEVVKKTNSVSALPYSLIKEDIDRGSLIEIKSDLELPEIPYYFLTNPEMVLSPIVEEFINFTEENIRMMQNDKEIF